jgi:tetratricopeptide (TPR) repeat protein
MDPRRPQRRYGSASSRGAWIAVLLCAGASCGDGTGSSSTPGRGASAGSSTPTSAEAGASAAGAPSAAPTQGSEPTWPIPQPDERDVAEGDFVALVRQHIGLVECAPKSPENVAALALVYQANDRWLKARLCYEQAARLDPSQPQWPYLAAACRRFVDEPAAVKADLDRTLKRFPSFYPLLHFRAELMVQEGDPAGAMKLLERALAMVPQEPMLLTAAGEALLQLGRAEDAVKALEQALETVPDFQLTHFLLGNAYRALGREEDAMQHMRMGAKGEHGRISVPWLEDFLSLGVTLQKRRERASLAASLGDLESAEKLLLLARPRDFRDERVLLDLGKVYYLAGKLDQAVQTFEEALTLEPKNWGARFHLILCRLDLGQYAEALSLAQALVELAPEQARGYLVLARSLRGLGRIDEARAAVAKALDIDPYDAMIQQENAQLDAASDATSPTGQTPTDGSSR